MCEEGIVGKMSSAPGKQISDKRNFWQQAKPASLYSGVLLTLKRRPLIALDSLLKESLMSASRSEYIVLPLCFVYR